MLQAGGTSLALQVQDLGLSTDEMLNRLRSNAGHWHQLAKYLPALQRAGVDSMVIEEMVGLERRLQNVWVAAEQVYESVKRSGEMDEAMLAYFDVEGGEALLYELRFLSIRQRTQAAIYIVTNDLSAQVSAAAAASGVAPPQPPSWIADAQYIPLQTLSHHPWGHGWQTESPHSMVPASTHLLHFCGPMTVPSS